MSMKSKGGRPPVEFDQERQDMAQGMVLLGIPYKEIARLLKVSENTLKKHLGPTLAEAKSQATSKVANNLFRMAMGKDKQACTAAIFYLKTQANWKETSSVEMSGPNGSPIDNVLRVEFVEAK